MKPTFVLIPLFLASLARAEFPEPYDTEPSPTKPMAAEEAAAKWRLPEGFRATVFAAEPDVRQPIAMAFDARGRLWVAECYTYAEAKHRFAKDLRDRIIIFEDTDNDGRHDKRTVFVEGLERLSSVEVGFGGVWVLASPNLLFYPDKDANGQPDGPPVVKLDGFEWEKNHHTMANGLRWGPDGWLYGRHGIQAVSALGQPGAPEERRAKTNGGIWRYHPQRGEVEIVCQGTTNPWGMDWNEHGEPFFINTVIGHLWHAIPGANFRRMHGQNLNPRVYEVIDQHADHLHWAPSEAWMDIRKLGVTDATSAAGGGHAHTGLLFYGGDNWPENWRGKLLTINFHGRRLNVENVQRTGGSGYVGKREPDVAFAADPWFRGIDLIGGPDGGVFIADWSDASECHESDGVHRNSGRIYKITHGQPKRPEIVDVDKLAPPELVKLLGHKNEYFARAARKRLQELKAAGADLGLLEQPLRRTSVSSPSAVSRLRSMWALHAIGGTGDEQLCQAWLFDDDEHVRSWAIKLMVDDKARLAGDENFLGHLEKRAHVEEIAFVRLALASALQRLPMERRMKVARPLMQRAEDSEDHNLPLMIWYGIESLPLKELALAVQGASATTRCIMRRLTSEMEGSGGLLDFVLTKASFKHSLACDVLTGMRDALRGQRNVKPPSAWEKVAPVFAKSADPKVRELHRELGAIFADPAALREMRETALDDKRPLEDRRSALRTLVDSRAPDLKALCESALTSPGLAATAVSGLALETDPSVAEAVLARINTVASAERSGVISGLITRASWAGKVLDAIAGGKLARSEINAYHARQIRDLGDQALTKRLGEVWGAIRQTDAARVAKLKAWKERLTPELLGKADLANGRVLYTSLCSSCHALNGQGGKIGPDLTGSDRGNLDYLISNVGDPNATVAKEYLLHTVSMKDGRVLSGYIRSRTDRTLELQTLTEALSLPAGDVSKVEEAPVSLMPEGLADALNESSLRDLFGYLMAK